MEISSFSNPSPTPPSKPAPSGVRNGAASASGPAAPVASDQSVNLGAVQSIQQAMNNLPDSRADVVARGKALAASATYPAAEIINKLAEMFIEDAEAAMNAD